MPLNSEDINNLKDQITNLGFSLDGIDLEKQINVTGDNVFKIPLAYPITDPSILAEHFSVTFIGEVPRDNSQNTEITVIIAQAYNQPPNGEKDLIADNAYHNMDRPLPDKEHILNTIRQESRVKNTIRKFGLENDTGPGKQIKPGKKF